MAITNLCARSLVTLGAMLTTVCGACGQVIRVGGEQVPEPREGTIRIATYNVLNLFDAHDDPSLTGRHDDCYSYDKTVRAKPQEEQAAVAAAIRRIDADVIGLQEIESFDALIEFRETHLADMGYVHAVSIDVGQERGIEQAVLSRFPIREATVWPNMPLGGVHPEKYGNDRNWNAGKPIEYRRSPLYVRIEVPASRGGEGSGGEPYELDLFVIHHKSGRYNGYWREKEAAKLVEIIKGLQAENPARNIAVLGDFNATPNAKSITTYTDAGMTHVVDRSSADASTLTHSSGRAIDFILLNEALAREMVAGSAFVLGTPVLEEGKDWRTEPAPPGYASDHMPVCVDITPQDK